MKLFINYLVIVFSMTPCAGATLAAEKGEGPYPVWWAPVIEYASEFGFTLEKLEDAEKLINVPFQHGMWVARKGEPQENGFEIHDCATYKCLA